MSQTGGTSSSAGSSGTRAQSSHPTYAKMIQEGLSSLKGKSASREALLKYMMKNYNLGSDEKAVNTHLKLALKSGLEKGTFVQSTGKGAAGTVRLGKAALAGASAKVATAKKPKAAAAAKKPKATAAKAASTKKTVKPKKVSLGKSAAKPAKAKKVSLTKKSTAKVAPKSKAAPKKAGAAKAKAKVAKPKATKKPMGRK